MYLSEPECTLLLGWGLQFWTRWLCFLYVARKAQAFPRRRTLCSSSWLKDWNCILFHHCEIQELTLEGAASDPLVLSAGSSELHKAFPLVVAFIYCMQTGLMEMLEATNGWFDMWVLIFQGQRKELNLDFEIWNGGCVLLHRAGSGYQCGTKSHWCVTDALGMPRMFLLESCTSFLTDSCAENY